MGSIAQESTICPPGSTVVVTGAHGFIATHIIDILLCSGFAVKGTTRNQEKATYIESVFHKRHPTASFTAVIVPDVDAPGALDEALKDSTGLVHPANDMSMVQDFEIGYTARIRAMKNVLESAANCPTLKRFVYTSSLNAVGTARPNHKAHLTPGEWNRYALEQVKKAQPPYADDYAMMLYQAAKVACEKLALEFVKERQPNFVYNATLPNVNAGPVLTMERPQGTGGFFMGVYYNNPMAVAPMSNELLMAPQQMVDVRDTAWLHVLALTQEDVKNERLIAASEPWSYNRTVEIMKSFAPEGHSAPEKKEGLAESMQTCDASRSLELLKRVGRNEGASAEKALRENCLGEGA